MTRPILSSKDREIFEYAREHFPNTTTPFIDDLKKMEFAPLLNQLNALNDEVIDLSENVSREKQLQMTQVVSKAFLYSMWPVSAVLAGKLTGCNEFFWLKAAMTLSASTTLNVIYDHRNQRLTVKGLFEKVGHNLSATFMTGVASVVWIQNSTDQFWLRVIAQMLCTIGYRSTLMAAKVLASNQTKKNLGKFVKDNIENFFWAALTTSLINMIGRELADEWNTPEIFTIGANLASSCVATWGLYRALEKNPFIPATTAYHELFKDSQIKDIIFNPDKYIKQKYNLKFPTNWSSHDHFGKGTSFQRI
ncbi:MAG: hypothetical protein EHM45_22110 [Desulfobacteraceae bacterium]|nr:MAG: hypothetical protein EHM45_22110 [Desulfobacteraceae bacterium]